MNLTIEVPDDVVRSLEVIAAAQGKSLQQLAAERLNSLVNVSPALQGSPAALLRAMTEPPHPSAEDVDDLQAAIASGRLPVRNRDLFSD